MADPPSWDYLSTSPLRPPISKHHLFVKVSNTPKTATASYILCVGSCRFQGCVRGSFVFVPLRVSFESIFRFLVLFGDVCARLSVSCRVLWCCSSLAVSRDFAVVVLVEELCSYSS